MRNQKISVKVRPYPIQLAKQEAVENDLKRMLRLKVIERSNSLFLIPIVPMFKKNGDVQLCLDARKINETIISDYERPLSIDSILAKFKAVKCISTLDLRSGYWQIPLEKQSQRPCSFLVNERNYSFMRLTFGLNISGVEFQKGMDTVLGGLTHDIATIYIDGILITSGSMEEHCKHLKIVMGRFVKHNITVNLEKFQFFRKNVTFLRHLLTTNRVRMDLNKKETR